MAQHADRYLKGSNFSTVEKLDRKRSMGSGAASMKLLRKFVQEKADSCDDIDISGISMRVVPQH